MRRRSSGDALALTSHTTDAVVRQSTKPHSRNSLSAISVRPGPGAADERGGRRREELPHHRAAVTATARLRGDSREPELEVPRADLAEQTESDRRRILPRAVDIPGYVHLPVEPPLGAGDLEIARSPERRRRSRGRAPPPPNRRRSPSRNCRRQRRRAAIDGSGESVQGLPRGASIRPRRRSNG